MLLAGDIGGTKTVLALVDVEKGVRLPVREETYASADFDALESIIARFLRRDEVEQIHAACFGVAGPVIDERSEITNLPWLVDARAIGRAFDIDQVRLLNDLEAIANAVPHMLASDLETLYHGVPEPAGAMAVIAPGTGLGEAYLTWDGQRYLAHASEGGHASFAPTTVEQQELLSYLMGRLEHVSYERVCSGSGIPNIYCFLRESGKYGEPGWLSKELGTAGDPTPVIARVARERKADICVATMELFVEILADEASNLALKVLATGGVYFGGGIPPRILPQLREPVFIEKFRRKGRFTELLAGVPVHVISNPRSALHGAAHFGLTYLENARR
jgi:glucokinase